MHKVLLAVDCSEASAEAARLLAHFPHRDEIELTILTVVQPPSMRSNYVTGELVELAFQREKDLANESQAKVCSMFSGANVSVNQLTQEGNIGTSIVEVAEEIGADLVVVGATGHSRVSRVLLGSVSDHVATHAPCSVLVVRASERSESAKPYRVCLAYDHRKPSQAALEEIAEIPWKTGTDFYVLSVAAYLYDFYGQLQRDPDVSQRYNQWLETAKEQLLPVAPSVQTHLIETEHLGEGIVKFAEQSKIDLLVLGETSRNRLTRFLLGSTSRYVLRHAPCSIWITRNRIIHSDENPGLVSGSEQ